MEIQSNRAITFTFRGDLYEVLGNTPWPRTPDPETELKLSKLSRTKGHSFERAVAKALRVVFPLAQRQLEYQENQCLGIDLTETGAYRIQCKRGRRYASLSAIEEVLCDEMLGEIPVLVTQGDRKRILVALPFEEFLRLIKAGRSAG